MTPTEPPDGSYDVVVYNPPTKNLDLMTDEINQIINLLDKETYWVEPNKDPGSDYIVERVQGLVKSGLRDVQYVETMPHDVFLGLLSRAKRVIGNSSCLYLEAPYFGCQTVQVGERNRVREKVELKPGGSKRVAKKLKQWLR